VSNTVPPDRPGQDCPGGEEAHLEHMRINDECPHCGYWRDANGIEHPEAEWHDTGSGPGASWTARRDDDEADR
jgi:hypothetical protein